MGSTDDVGSGGVLCTKTCRDFGRGSNQWCGPGRVKFEVSRRDYLIISDLETGKAESGKLERK